MRILGHPVHPMFIVYPIAMFTVAVILDIVYLITGAKSLPTVTFYMIAAGIVGGLIAAVFGFIDWLGLQAGSRAKRLGAWHGGGNFTMVVLFLISWLLRLGAQGHVPSALALILSFAGAAISLVTAWLGGELVYRLGSAVEPGANPNAPSSLSGQPASTSSRDMRQRTQ
jgi:uncharacterized membrane protein